MSLPSSTPLSLVSTTDLASSLTSPSQTPPQKAYTSRAKKDPTLYPPFYTLQPTLLTRSSQLTQWSSLLLSHYRSHRLYKLSLPAALSAPPFHNARLKKRMKLEDAREVLGWMCGTEGAGRAEWIVDGADRKAGKEMQAWIWWRRPEEWAEVLQGWVEERGLRGVVLTFWELRCGEGTVGEDFHGMDPEVLMRSLHILVKRGKAQVFGSEDEQGVKFF